MNRASIASAFFSSVWPTNGHDRTLRKNLGQALTEIPAFGVIGHIAERQTTLSQFQLRLRVEPDKRRQIEKLTRKAVFDKHAELSKEDRKQPGYASRIAQGPIRLDVSAAATILAGRLGEDAKPDIQALAALVLNQKESTSADTELVWPKNSDDLNYAVMFYDADDANDAKGNDENWLDFHAANSLPMIHFVMRRRERIFAPFSSDFSKYYWNESDPLDRNADECPPLTPPWEDSRTSHRTVTLSFDLRKSTFCMAMADSLPDYAQWIDQVIQVLIAVTHFNGGVFGNFTGDGCIVYFLEEEYRNVHRKGNRTRPKKDKPSAVIAALECATDMQRAIGHLLEDLYPNLRVRSDLLGAGIAIAMGDAHWSYDYSDYYSNLIVVGPSVVDACRLCDSAKADMILMGENAYLSLPKPFRKALRSETKRIKTKEYGVDQAVSAWTIKRPWLERHYGTPQHRIDIEKICKKIRKRSSK